MIVQRELFARFMKVTLFLLIVREVFTVHLRQLTMISINISVRKDSFAHKKHLKQENIFIDAHWHIIVQEEPFRQPYRIQWCAPLELVIVLIIPNLLYFNVQSIIIIERILKWLMKIVLFSIMVWNVGLRRITWKILISLLRSKLV